MKPAHYKFSVISILVLFIFGIYFFQKLKAPFSYTKTNAVGVTSVDGGDGNGDGKVDGIDFILWLSHYNQSTGNGPRDGDFNSNGYVDGVDFTLWFANYGRTIATPTNTIRPTNTNTPTPSGPTPTLPPIGQVKGIWISQEELNRLPTSGAAWDKVNAAANSSWGSACLYDNNCNHDVNTLAGALVAARTGNASMRAKTIAGITAAMNETQFSRVLEMSRGFQTYIIAADIIGYRTPEFEQWIRNMVVKPLAGHSGGGNLLETAEFSANNWGGHSRASLAAAGVYLNDANMISKVVTAQRAFIGISAPGNQMVYTSTNWHADPGNKAGENRKGATRNGISISGVLPEDWRRTAEYQWPPQISGYMWEGMQGYIVATVILQRAGLLSLAEGDNALMRAMDILYHKGEAAINPTWVNAASGDDTWIPWVANYYLNENRYPTQSASPGKNMGWTDWTHVR